jgi:hypothetical protein
MGPPPIYIRGEGDLNKIIENLSSIKELII